MKKLTFGPREPRSFDTIEPVEEGDRFAKSFVTAQFAIEELIIRERQNLLALERTLVRLDTIKLDDQSAAAESRAFVRSSMRDPSCALLSRECCTKNRRESFGVRPNDA
jgi:hypothetical protein